MGQDPENTLEDIKKLMIFDLTKKGCTTAEIGAVLGVSYKTIERMVPKVKKKK